MLIQSLFRSVATCLLVGCAFSLEAYAQVSASEAAILASPLRTDRDRQADARRQPLELLKLAKVAPGMSILDISSGGGYTAQVLAVAVGSTGKVWAQIAKPAPALDARLAATPQPNFQILARPFDDLFPSELPRVDGATLILSYHDIVNTSTDRAKMNQAIFNALKPGGFLVVMDHAAKAGTGLNDTSTLHRIDEQAVVAELVAVGFKADTKSDAWRNAADTHELHSNKMETTSDRFALRFVRPN